MKLKDVDIAFVLKFDDGESDSEDTFFIPGENVVHIKATTSNSGARVDAIVVLYRSGDTLELNPSETSEFIVFADGGKPLMRRPINQFQSLLIGVSPINKES